MKPQSMQKLFIFIIALFSISSTFAQCKKNEMLVCHTSRACDCFGCCTICKCEKIQKESGPHLARNTTPSDVFSTSVINSTSINVALAKAQSVSLKIYDITGKLIKTLVDSRMPGGDHQIDWDKKDEAGNTINSGIYILQFNAGSYSNTRRLSII